MTSWISRNGIARRTCPATSRAVPVNVLVILPPLVARALISAAMGPTFATPEPTVLLSPPLRAVLELEAEVTS